MAAPKIRADHDGLQSVSQKFAQQAEATRRILGQTKADKSTLESGDWQGKGAAAFYREMNDMVIPTLERLARALESASQVTKQISGVMKQVEEEASGLLDGSKVGGPGGGAADGAGNGAGAPGSANGGLGDSGAGGAGAGGGPGGGSEAGGGDGGAAGGEGEAGIGDFMQDQIDGGGGGSVGGESGAGGEAGGESDYGGEFGSDFGDDFSGGADSPIGQAVSALDGASGDELLDQFNQAGRDLLANFQNQGQDGDAENPFGSQGGSGSGGGGSGGGGAGEALAALGADDPSAFDGLLDQSLGGGGGGGSPSFGGGGSSGGGGSGGGAPGGQAVPRALNNSGLSGNQKLLALAIQILKKDPNAFNGELKRFVEAALANGEMGPATAALRGSLRTLQGAVQTAGGNVSDQVMAQVSQLEQSFSSILPSDGGGAPPPAGPALPSQPAAPVIVTPPPSNDAIMNLVDQFTTTVQNIVPSMAGQ